nr:reverse transcriptase domain-containing protein [Tanacetum cinerariifolium]
MTLPNPQKHVVSRAVLTPSKLLPITAARPVTAAVLKPHVTKPRQDKFVVTKPHSPPRRHINHSPSLKASSFSLKVTAVKVSQGNLQHALKNKEVIDSGCLRHMTWNMSYLSDFKELNGGYVAFGGNPKGDYEEIDRGFVAFGGNPKGGRITGKDIKGINSSFYTHKILMEDEFKPTIQPQRRVHPNIKEGVKKEVIKLLDAGLIYPTSDSPWGKLSLSVENEAITFNIGKSRDLDIPMTTICTVSITLQNMSKNNGVDTIDHDGKWIETKKKITHKKSRLDWSLPFEIMSDASDYAVEAVLGQRNSILKSIIKNGAENLAADNLS